MVRRGRREDEILEDREGGESDLAACFFQFFLRFLPFEALLAEQVVVLDGRVELVLERCHVAAEEFDDLGFPAGRFPGFVDEPDAGEFGEIAGDFAAADSGFEIEGAGLETSNEPRGPFAVGYNKACRTGLRWRLRNY